MTALALATALSLISACAQLEDDMTTETEDAYYIARQAHKLHEAGVRFSAVDRNSPAYHPLKAEYERCRRVMEVAIAVGSKAEAA